MSRRIVGKRKEVKVDLASYSYLLNGIGGIGKTTLAYEVGEKLYGKNGVMILTVGEEPEPDHLGGILADKADTWTDLAEIIDVLVEYRNTDYKELKVIVPDTVDEIFRLAEQEIIDEYNKGMEINKRIKSIAQAYGGFQKGENKVVDLVVSTLFKLRSAGYCIFFLGHTKQKNKKDLMEDIEYEQLTSNLDAKYYTAIKDKVNVVACAYTERKMNDIETVRDAFSKKDKQIGKIASEKRVIVFRDEEYAIDVKSHFIDIEPKIEFDVGVFINTIHTAIRKQHERYHGKTSDKEFKDIKGKQEDQRVADLDKEEILDLDIEGGDIIEIDDNEINEEKSKALIKEFTPLYKSADVEMKAKVKAILEENGSKTLDTKLPVKVFIEIQTLLNTK